MASLITAWTLALMLGVRHASEPDHLVAVSTLVAGADGARRAALLGAIWGIGHTLSLLGVGGGLLLVHRQLPERLGALFELGVACMLLLLGTHSIARGLGIWRARAARQPDATAAHAQRAHAHAAPQPDAQRAQARRPLLIGLVHGLAGSGALTALALADMPSFGSSLAYIVCFGVGSIVGMAALSGVLGLPLGRFARRTVHVRAGALAATGVLSLALGVAWGWPILWRVSAG